MSYRVQRSRQEWLRRYVSFIFILFVIAFGTSLSIRANLGSSPISAPPYVLSLVPGMPLTMGMLTILMHVFFIGSQILLLGKNYDKLQLTQILVSFLFGFYTDLTMWITGFLQVPFDVTPALGYPIRLLELLAGGAILAWGIAMEVRCDSLMLAGEGFPLAIAKATGKDFSKVKMCSDTGLVTIGTVFMFFFFGHWDWKLIGVGTLISMLYVGFMVRTIAPHLAWLDRIFIPRHERVEQEDTHEGDRTPEKPFVITIARTCGSGGKHIGHLLAKRLGVAFYDRKLIDETAQELGYTPDFVENSEQNISTGKLWELIITGESLPASLNPSHDDAIFLGQSRIIRKIAQERPCVIIGRCANWILRDNNRVLKVFITAHEADAIKCVMESEHLTETEAKRKIERINTGRSNHYWHYTGGRWNDAKHYDLIVNVSEVGIDKAIDMITNRVVM